MAYKKAKKLLEYGANIEIVSPEIDDRLYNLLSEEKILVSTYHKELCQGKLIIIAATDDYNLNKEIAEDATEAGALFNAVDEIALCQFIVPAIVHRGDLQLAICTGGKSPALAGMIRRELEIRFDEDYEKYLQKLGVIRRLIKSSVSDQEIRKKLLIKIAELFYERGKENVTQTQTAEEK